MDSHWLHATGRLLLIHISPLRPTASIDHSPAWRWRARRWRMTPPPVQGRTEHVSWMPPVEQGSCGAPRPGVLPRTWHRWPGRSHTVRLR